MYDMFKLFQTGRSHMVLLTQPPPAATPDSAAAAAAAAAAGVGKAGVAPFSPRPAVPGSGDASGVPLGIITIEDVIEELMQTEIGAAHARGW
jgi:metal transporter CNNM